MILTGSLPWEMVELPGVGLEAVEGRVQQEEEEGGEGASTEETGWAVLEVGGVEMGVLGRVLAHQQEVVGALVAVVELGAVEGVVVLGEAGQ